MLRWKRILSLKSIVLIILLEAVIGTIIYLIGNKLLEWKFHIRLERFSNPLIVFLAMTFVGIAHILVVYLMAWVLRIKDSSILWVFLSVAAMVLIFLIIGFSTFGIVLNDAFTVKNLICLMLMGVAFPFILRFYKEKQKQRIEF